MPSLVEENRKVTKEVEERIEATGRLGDVLIKIIGSKCIRDGRQERYLTSSRHGEG